MGSKSKNNPAPPKFTTKTTYSLASPYFAPAWPKLDPKAQDTILELLCQLLSPIGEHRRKHVVPSKGRRAGKKRKREVALEAVKQLPASPPVPVPVPVVSDYVLVGFNSVHGALEDIVQGRRVRSGSPGQDGKGHGSNDEIPTSKQPAVIFVDRSAQPAIMQSHLPLLVSTASNHLNRSNTSSNNDEDCKIYLVPLPNGSEPKLCSALHIPRVGLIGVAQGTPGGKALLDFVLENVEFVDAAGSRAEEGKRYQPLKLDAHTAWVEVKPAKAARRQMAKDTGAEGRRVEVG